MIAGICEIADGKGHPPDSYVRPSGKSKNLESCAAGIEPRSSYGLIPVQEGAMHKDTIGSTRLSLHDRDATRSKD